MTTESSDRAVEDVPASSTGSDTPTRPGTPTTAGTVLTAAGARIRRDPVLVAPFAIAGLLVALADWLRERDPIPAATPDSFGQTLSVQYSIFPRGTARTVRHVDALLDLRTPYLLGAVALELLVPLAVGLAGYLTIARALDAERRLGPLVGYLGSSSAVVLLPGVVGFPSVDVDSLPLGTAALVVVSLVMVRLFLFPGFLAAGDRFATALRRSVRESRGIGWTLFWLIVTFGLASWGLAHVPVAGGFLSTAVVAPLHAVSLAVLTRTDDRERGGRGRTGRETSPAAVGSRGD